MDHLDLAEPQHFHQKCESNASEHALFNIRAGVSLLLPELKAIEEANRRYEIGADWQTSSSFRGSLWRDFREEFGITTSGLSDIRKGGQEMLFDDVNTAIQYLKSMVTVLDVLKTTAQNILAPVEVEWTRVGRTFGLLLESLPTELLALTMRYACYDVYGLITLSHVNRRFRDIAFSMTSMWSADLTSFMPTKILQLCLERSKNAPLHFDFNEEGNEFFLENSFDPPVPEFHLRTCLTEIAQQTLRWKDFRFVMSKAMDGNVHGDSFARYRTIGELFLTCSHVPRLTSLSLSHRGFLPDIPLATSDSNRVQKIDCVHFYRSWKAPNLRSISFSGIVPVAMPGTSIETLSLDLRVQRQFMDFSAALQNLHSFVRETPTLRKVVIWTYSSGVTGQSHVRNFPTITLGNLQEFVLVLDEPAVRMDSDTRFSLFVDCLRLPVLSTLVVKIALAQPKDTTPNIITGLVNSFIPQQLGAPRLTDLSIFVYDPSATTRRIMKLALGNFPSIRTLTLGMSGLLVCSPALHADVVERGSLEQINLLLCTKGIEAFLDRFIERLRKGGGLRNLKRVVVQKCLPAGKRRLLGFIPEEMLEFEGLTREDSIGYGHWHFLKLGYYCGYGDYESDDDDEDDDEDEEF